MIIDILGEEVDFDFIKSKFQLQLDQYVLDDQLDQFVLKSNTTSDIILIDLGSYFKNEHNFIIRDLNNCNVLLEFEEPSIKFNFHFSILDMILRLINLMIPYNRVIHTSNGYKDLMYLTTLKKISVKIDQEYDLFPLSNLMDYEVDINGDFIVLIANNTFPISTDFLNKLTQQLLNLISGINIEFSNDIIPLIDKIDKLNKKEILFLKFFNTFLTDQIGNLINFKVIETKFQQFYNSNFASKYFILKETDILFYTLKLSDFMGIDEEDFLLSYLIYNRIFLSYTTITNNYLELFTFSLVTYFYFYYLSIKGNLNTGKKLLKEFFMLFSLNFLDLTDIEKTRIYVIFKSVLMSYQNGKIPILFDNLIKVINVKDMNILNYLSDFILKKYELQNLDFVDLNNGFMGYPYFLYYAKDKKKKNINPKLQNFYLKNLIFENVENWISIKTNFQINEILSVNVFSISYNDNILFPDFNNAISKVIPINPLNQVSKINLLIEKLVNLINNYKNELVLIYVGVDEILLKIYTNDYEKFSHL